MSRYSSPKISDIARASCGEVKQFTAQVVCHSIKWHGKDKKYPFNEFVLSDGRYYIHARNMGRRTVDLGAIRGVFNPDIEENSIIKVTNYMPCTNGDRRYTKLHH